MNVFIICLIVTISIVYIYDWVEFPRTFLQHITSLILKKDVKEVRLPKLLKCSLCASTWITLIILLFIKPEYFYVCLLYGFFTKYILYAIQTIDNLLSLIFISLEVLYTKIKKTIL